MDELVVRVVARAQGAFAVLDLEQLVGAGLPVGEPFPFYGVVRPIGKCLHDFRRQVLHEPDLLVRILDLLLLHTVGHVVLDLHPCSLGFHAQVDVLGHQGDEAVRIVVPYPDRGSKDPVVRDIVVEHVLHGLRERMVGLDLYVAQVLAYRHPVRSEGLAFGDAVDVAHEPSGVVGELVVAFLELVKFLDHHDRYHDVVVLELADSLVVVEDDVGVQDEDLRSALRPPHSFSSSVLCHIF